MNQSDRIGKAGSGDKIHVVSMFQRAEGDVIESIYCGAQQFNGTGNGQLRRSYPFDATKITCKRCLKRLSERKV